MAASKSRNLSFPSQLSVSTGDESGEEVCDALEALGRNANSYVASLLKLACRDSGTQWAALAIGSGNKGMVVKGAVGGLAETAARIHGLAQGKLRIFPDAAGDDDLRESAARCNVHFCVAIPVSSSEDRPASLVVMDDKPREKLGSDVADSLGEVAEAMAYWISVQANLREVREAYLRQGAERAAAEQQRQMIVALLEKCGDLVGMATEDGQWFYLNPTGQKMVGMESTDEVQGQSMESLLVPDDVIRLRDEVLPAVRSAGQWQGEQRLRNLKTGETIETAANIFAVRDPQTDRLLCIAFVSRDMTAEKRGSVELQRAKEVAEEAARAKSLFLANMSHEIRTPMNAVIGMTSLLLETELTREQQEYSEIIRSSGDALLTLIDRVLDFSKIESGKMELETTPFDLSECIGDVFDLLAHRASDRGIELGFVFSSDVPHSLVGDVGRIRQILVNLLGNAIKFTERGEVLLSVNVEKREDTVCILHFAVRDTGVGIPADRLDRLFASFSQVDASTTRKFGGTGLGLAISKRLAELMNGTMWVESTLGKGSTFHFTAQLTIPEAPSPAFEPSIFAGTRVLLITQSPVTRQVIESYGKAWGAAIEHASSMHDAVERVREEPIAIAIVDASLSDVSPESASELRGPIQGRKVPLIFLHPLVWKQGVSLRNKLRKDVWFVSKPIKPSAIFDALVSALQGPATASPSTARRNTIDEGMALRLPYRILLAEDHPVNQKIAVLMLSRFGYRPDVVTTGLQALEALHRQHYDVVFMDIQMPEMDGLEATRHIRQSFPAERQPWIVAMTANASIADREACFAAGMNEFVSKPVRAEDVKNVLEKAGVTPAASPADQELMVPETLRSLTQNTGGDPSLVSDIYAMFFEDARTTIEEMETLWANRDLEALRKKGHYLKGSAMVVGAGMLAHLCLQIEATQDANWSSLETQISTAKEVMESTESVVNQLLQSRKE